MTAQIHTKTHHLTDRLARMQQACRDRYTTYPGWQKAANEAYAYNELYEALPLRLRQACSTAYAMTHEPVYVFPEESLHGIYYHKDNPFESSDYKKPKQIEGEPPRAREMTAVPGMAELLGKDLPEEDRTEILSGGAGLGHITWNWDQMLALGAEGLLAQHRDALEKTTDPTAMDFHRSVIISLQAMLDWNRRHIAELRKLLEAETDPANCRRLRESIATMERVPAKPATTFREALQSYHFQWTSVMYESPNGGNSPGRMDYFLWPYLKEEFESGALSSQDVFEMIAELFLKMDERVHRSDGHGNSVVIGGIAPDGSDAVSPLTYIMIDVMEQLNVTHPYFYNRVHSSNPEEYKRRAVRFLLEGSNRGQIFNDDAILKALMLDGHMPFEDAARYACGGCMEISPQGQNSDLIYSFVYNIPKTLELCITGGHDLITSRQRLAMDHALPDFETFEDFYQYFMENVRSTLLAKFQVLDIYSEHAAKHRPWNLMSSMIDDCLARGREQHDGGARYHDYGGTTIGMPNAADALTAIKVAVFDRKICDAPTLIQALQADFEGYEVLRSKLRKLPKFGQGNAEADGMMNRLLQDVHEVYASYKNRFGGVVKLMQLTFVFAPRFGASLGASADGNKAKEPVAHSMTPQFSAMTEGLTAAINSYTSLDNTLIAGGGSTMWDMDPEWINEELLNAIVSTFLTMGGQIFQGNVSLSAEELAEAQKNPEKHYNLIVRVGGFSARFVNLGKPLQDEIIARRLHRVA